LKRNNPYPEFIIDEVSGARVRSSLHAIWEEGNAIYLQNSAAVERGGMITLFSTLRPSIGDIRVNQLNAVRSWRRLHPDYEIILMGNDAGTAQIAEAAGARHIPDIRCDERGIPVFNELFKVADAEATNDVLCYVNADIILMDDFRRAVQSVIYRGRPFLMVGQRWDLTFNEEINFNDKGWESKLRHELAINGHLHPPIGSDYFVYKRGFYKGMPAFMTGRGGFDNWMIFQARQMQADVIDASPVVTIVHQNHPRKEMPANEVEDDTLFTLDHVTLLLTSKGIKRPSGLRYLFFYIVAIPVLNPRLYFLRKITRNLTMTLIKMKHSIAGRRAELKEEAK
jgi:hypothetical protein